eukprot:3241993-Pyramimonas_sp.AAC.1
MSRVRALHNLLGYRAAFAVLLRPLESFIWMLACWVTLLQNLLVSRSLAGLPNIVCFLTGKPCSSSRAPRRH